ncbi:MAG: parvulin peptidyl-prolyl isomerase [Ignavibacteriae bacterium HGW-Ignavibacteriae-3]|nr:MAG: parvulin peptidyl-prolyl isomerase [Ignavibacteriae bacterium HGW-Ignavibacteriae-3]
MKKFLVVFFVFAGFINAQKVLDKIVAVVDNEIILQSEFEFRAGIEAQQRNINPADTTFRRQILNSMIEEKLLFAQAELDSITVTEDQIKQQLDYQINYFTQQYGSREKLEQVYGMPVEKLRRSLQDDVKKNLMAEMLKQKKFGQMEASRKEVEDFYLTYKDSLGIVAEKFKIAHIFQNPKTGDRVKKNARDLAIRLVDSLKNGADFAKLAAKYSDDPGSAAQGGDLGFVKRGVFYPEFEAAAFALAPNQLSGIIESPVGYHIIQMMERRGESIHTRHILVKVKSDDESDLKAIEFLTELRDSIVRGKNNFEYYAKNYSDDKETARFGGVLGIFEVSQLDKSLLDIIYKLKVGDISYPKRLEIDQNIYGYHIVKLLERIPEHKADLDLDYAELKRMSEYYKKQQLFAHWIEEIKQRIYWDVRL